ncbi:MAG: RNA polymerase sigma factor [Putridiphycobacter sp.]
MLLNLFSRRHIAKLSDEDLVLEIKKGQSNKAIGELYKRYMPLMYGVSLKYLKDKMSADDLIMGVFEKIESKIVKSEIKNLKNWLYTVTKNECLMVLRKTNKLAVEVENALLFKADESQELFEQTLLKEQRFTVLENAITKLKDVQKICIELFYLKNKCYDEIAEETGFELKKVKSYIQNGKRNLKLILENEQIFKS